MSDAVMEENASYASYTNTKLLFLRNVCFDGDFLRNL